MSKKLCQNCQQLIAIDAQFCGFCGTRQATQPLTGRLPPQHKLDDRYVIESLIGQGGMGAVYRALDTRFTGRICAIKEMSVLSLLPEERPYAVRSFQQEAELLATLKHPNLPQVHDFFSDNTNGRHYLVMDYVEGADLEDMLYQNGHPFSEAQVRGWAEQLCDVLTYLHSQSPPVIFRDLKPDNIMLDKHGQLKLIDFGIARFFQPSKSKDTQAMGTPGYVPPEQYGKGQTDPRSDVYSLGVTLWRLLTVQDPTDDPYQLPGVRTYNQNVSPELESTIIKAMELKPEARFQSTQDLKNALTSPLKSSPAPQTDGKSRKGLWIVLGIILFVIVACGGIFIAFMMSIINTPISEPEPEPAQTIVVVTEVLPTPIPEEETDTPEPIVPTPTDEPIIEEVIEEVITNTPIPTNTPTPIPPADTPTPTPDSLPSSIIGRDGVDMILVPAGFFIMGSTSSDVDAAVSMCSQSGNNCPRSYFTNEMPQREVYLSDYYIDATEITNEQYSACVDAGACTRPSDSGAPDSRYMVDNYYVRSQFGDYPVVRVRWQDAKDYCAWVGEQLPTEAQWEKAARGIDGRVFPWGNSFDRSNANTEDNGGDSLKPVGSYANGRSPYGVYDMAGNVWEYVADYYSDTYYQNATNQDPTGPNSGSDPVLRGGSYSDFKEYARVTNRGTPHAGSSRSGFRGFRCAFSVD